MLVAEAAQLVRRQSVYLYSVHNHRPRVRFIQRTDYLKQRSLARAARADDAHYLTLIYVQVYSFQYLQRAETLGNVFYVYHNLKPPLIPKGNKAGTLIRSDYFIFYLIAYFMPSSSCG